MARRRKPPQPRIGRGWKPHNVCGKIRYKSATEAALGLLSTWVASARHPRREEIRSYPCDVCKGWHLTSKPPRPPEGPS